MLLICVIKPATITATQSRYGSSRFVTEASAPASGLADVLWIDPELGNSAECLMYVRLVC